MTTKDSMEVAREIKELLCSDTDGSELITISEGYLMAVVAAAIDDAKRSAFADCISRKDLEAMIGRCEGDLDFLHFVLEKHWLAVNTSTEPVDETAKCVHVETYTIPTTRYYTFMGKQIKLEVGKSYTLAELEELAKNTECAEHRP